MENQPPYFDPNNPQNQNPNQNQNQYNQQYNYNQNQPPYGGQNIPPYGGGMPNPFGGGQVDIPNATAVLVLGICSIVGCICYGIPGIICGIIALILGGKAIAEYEANPNMYTQSSYNNAKAGRICAIIGTILSVLFLVYVIFMWIFLGSFYLNMFDSLNRY